jgi:hypothetical protein
MVFNATFNNISVTSWRSALLVEETGGPEKTCRKSLTTVIYAVVAILDFSSGQKHNFVLKVNSVNNYIQLEHCMRWISIICLHL